VKTGIIVLGHDSESPQGRSIVMKICSYLESKGHRNVFPAFHIGEPRSNGVIRMMFEEHGVDTFSILPVMISEGNLTIWNMPKRIGLPDNSGSWMMVGEHDVATRFATAMGASDVMADAILSRLGRPDADTGVIILTHGSELSLAERTADYYSERVKGSGWRSTSAYTKTGPRDIGQAVRELQNEGCRRFMIVPLTVTTDGRYFSRSIEELNAMGVDYEIFGPVSGYPEFLQIMESKVPEDW
jgi:sirohydrochlorin ferrochelatase